MRNPGFIVLLALASLSFSCKSQQNILILGDSHGAVEQGWVYHLQKLRPKDKFCNLSISGNIIGFSNLDRDTLNTIRNIHSYLERGKLYLDKIDKVLILLGTNDCKSVFNDSLNLVASRFGILITSIQRELSQSNRTKIVYITPPPFADDKNLTEKYKGGNKRLKMLIPKLVNTAKKQGVKCINLNRMMGVKAGEMTTDGVHYSNEGYEKIAKKINNHL